MTASIAFLVLGKPQPQGSKTKGRYGNIREANTNLQPWRDSVAWTAKKAMTEQEVEQFTGAVELQVEFMFARPKSHYTTKGALTKNAPMDHTSKPDLDKLVRSIGDSLVAAGLLRDDSLVVRVKAGKVWSVDKLIGEGARIIVRGL